ncbi:hypothetical protein CONPUDRAFT_156835 [Coniophora puteana RWD-64-598 SS2]|uniref:Uncharacterized protein n=1 Tax=Coniophora puteana (strain RWD-64-598) TaxID=741705 RepID=A0A5M3MG93_CONPW|nr:uncharacterized protein CONPUDRAFT_156835 [Coniophora puteana RWD-64-598 SS2]EIW77635.1 hypothetical protein CONPUDRAFT_156835 [Coniophora puteana RWD-64-598 SS2]
MRPGESPSSPTLEVVTATDFPFYDDVDDDVQLSPARKLGTSDTTIPNGPPRATGHADQPNIYGFSEDAWGSYSVKDELVQVANGVGRILQDLNKAHAEEEGNLSSMATLETAVNDLKTLVEGLKEALGRQLTKQGEALSAFEKQLLKEVDGVRDDISHAGAKAKDQVASTDAAFTGLCQQQELLRESTDVLSSSVTHVRDALDSTTRQLLEENVKLHSLIANLDSRCSSISDEVHEVRLSMVDRNLQDRASLQSELASQGITVVGNIVPRILSRATDMLPASNQDWVLGMEGFIYFISSTVSRRLQWWAQMLNVKVLIFLGSVREASLPAILYHIRDRVPSVKAASAHLQPTRKVITALWVASFTVTLLYFTSHTRSYPVGEGYIVT